MGRYLMDLCFKYQNGDCPNEQVSTARRSREVKEAEEPPFFPSGQAQEELDRICENCRERMFNIEKAECPVCHGGIGPATIKGWSSGSMKAYQYRCLHCDSLLYSFKEMI